MLESLLEILARTVALCIREDEPPVRVFIKVVLLIFLVAGAIWLAYRGLGGR